MGESGVIEKWWTIDVVEDVAAKNDAVASLC